MKKSLILTISLVALIGFITFTLAKNKKKIEANKVVVDRSKMPIAVATTAAEFKEYDGKVILPANLELNNEATYEEICAEMKAQSEGALKGVLGYTTDKVVATDFRGETCTSVFDADAGIALDSTFVKVVAWYDNEWGYSNKCLEMARVVGR